MIPPQAVGVRDIHPREQKICMNVVVVRSLAYSSIIGYDNSLIYEDPFYVAMDYGDGRGVSSRLDQAKVRGVDLGHAASRFHRTVLIRQTWQGATRREFEWSGLVINPGI